IFTINITDVTFTSCNIELMWENIKIVIPVTAHNETRINEYIDVAIHSDSAPHYQIATYYFEKKQHPEKAKMAIDKALEQQPGAFYMWHLKAKIEKMNGNKDEAVSAANRSAELAVGTPYEYAYRHLNQLLLADVN